MAHDKKVGKIAMWCLLGILTQSRTNCLIGIKPCSSFKNGWPRKKPGYLVRVDIDRHAGEAFCLGFQPIDIHKILIWISNKVKRGDLLFRILSSPGFECVESRGLAGGVAVFH